MYKAEHEKMYQEANQGLIEIRKQEIDFYLRVNSALGTQAALICGFVYLTFTQNVDFNYVWTPYVNAIYFVGSAITMAFATHVILCTMLIQIYGPGLALNGPIGSMARATEGMKAEQAQIVQSFFFMMRSFSITTVLLFWVAMDFYASIVGTFFYLVAMRYWVHYMNRIRNRFYWDDSKSQAGIWKERTSRESSSDEPTVDSIQMRVSNIHQQLALGVGGNPMHGTRDVEAGYSDCGTDFRGSVSGASASNPRPSLSGKFVERMSFMMPVGVKQTVASGNHDSNTGNSNAPSVLMTRPSTAAAGNMKDIVVEGFVTMNLVSELKKRYWERRYVVLNYKAQLIYYKNRQDFRSSPMTTMLNGRPLELDEYHVKYSKHEEFSETSSVSVTGDINGVVAKFVFSLTRRDDPSYASWHYKLDTEEELDMWVAAMRVVCPSCFQNTTAAENAV